ncbi:MAG: hypothetical protein ACRD26_21815 [Vicinamibacterales bacterium]
MKRCDRRLGACLAVAALPAWVALGHADDPVYWMEAIASASHVTVTMYQTRPGAQVEFVSEMVTSGPFSRMLSGFANEKIVQGLPSADTRLTSRTPGTSAARSAAGADGGSDVYSSSELFAITRYHDEATAERVDAERDDALRPYLASPPVRVAATVVEHLVPDWGWERGVPPRVIPLAGRVAMQQVFGRDGTCLGFFKAGYTGQIGLLEFFDPGVTIDAARKVLAERAGMSGSSLMKDRMTGRLLAYSEFFRAPEQVRRQRLDHLAVAKEASGASAGVVVENYFSR